MQLLLMFLLSSIETIQEDNIEFMERHQIGTIRDHASMLILLTYLEIPENSGGGATTEMDHSVTLI